MEVRPQPDEGERLAIERALREAHAPPRGAAAYRSAWRNAAIDENARRGLGRAELPRGRHSSLR
jgi:hypothetical protein